jgi:hypothetical protein
MKPVETIALLGAGRSTSQLLGMSETTKVVVIDHDVAPKSILTSFKEEITDTVVLIENVDDYLGKWVGTTPIAPDSDLYYSYAHEEIFGTRPKKEVHHNGKYNDGVKNRARNRKARKQRKQNRRK